MCEEMTALEKNGTWELVDIPMEKQPTSRVQVGYTVKYKVDGSIDRYKSRQVAKGFTWTYGIDYQETIALVAKMNSIRVLLSIATNKEWPLWQLDVKNAFLHGDLHEKVYMMLLPGFKILESEGNVCKLRKTLYELKQSLKVWFENFNSSLTKIGYRQS